MVRKRCVALFMIVMIVVNSLVLDIMRSYLWDIANMIRKGR